MGDDEFDAESYEPEWGRSRVHSARESGARLQGLSRGQSRRGSIGGGGGGGDSVRGHGEAGEEEEDEEEEIGPDFVNAEEDGGGEEEGEEVDEGEMKRVVMGRVGGWVDWAVGWMDFRGEGEEEGDVDAGADAGGGAVKEEEEEEGGGGKEGGASSRGEVDPVELQKRLRKKKKRWDDEAERGSRGTNFMSSAPEQAGVWSDAKWLLGVATKVAL